jgi:ribonuclease-3
VCSAAPVAELSALERERLEQLAKRVGHQFHDLSLLGRALAHRSWCAETPGEVSNERLEFLGDAVLGWVVADLAYGEFDELPEGLLTDLRKSVVNAFALAQVAEEIDLGPHIKLGKGEEKTAGRGKDSLLANAFEAVIAALYLDGGMSVASAFLDRMLSPQLSAAIQREPTLQDFKSLLQEELQAVGRSLPVYRVVGEDGPDHEKTFLVELVVDEEPLAEGEGKTKKAAEQVAAEVALADLRE